MAGRCFTVKAASANEHLPRALTADTPYLAVSASLQWGPWKESGFFRPLDGVRPACYTPDTTIAIYRTADIPAPAPFGPDSAGRVAQAADPARSSRVHQ